LDWDAAWVFGRNTADLLLTALWCGDDGIFYEVLLNFLGDGFRIRNTGMEEGEGS
jgi:hypothetical protein